MRRGTSAMSGQPMARRRRHGKNKKEAKQDERPESPSSLSVKGDDMDNELSFIQGAHDTQNKREMRQERAESPISDCLSMKSNRSMELPITFKGQPMARHGKNKEAKQDERPESPSCLSVKGDDMDHQLSFNQGAHDTQNKREMRHGRAESPTDCLSMKSNRSMEPPITFKGEMRQERAESPTSDYLSMKSNRSMEPPITFKGKVQHEDLQSLLCQTGKEESTSNTVSSFTPTSYDWHLQEKHQTLPFVSRMPKSDTTQLSSGGAFGEMYTEYHSIDRVVGSGTSEFPQKIDDWSTQHVREWLIRSLKVPERFAQILYDQDVSGGSLLCFEKKDLIDLGVTTGPAIQIIKNLEKLKKNAESLERNAQPSDSISRAITEGKVVGKYEQTQKIDTVISDSDTQSMSSSWTSLEGQGQSDVNQSGIPVKTPLATSEHMTAYEFMEDNVSDIQTLSIPTDNTKDTAPHSKRQCLPCPFDTNDSSFTYTQDDILPPAAGSSNLLDPVHEYKLLPNTEEASKREILYEFSKEVFTFAASCMNSRTNGTIHFGVNGGSENTHGQVIGQNISSVTEYIAEFHMRQEQHFEENIRIAKACVRPPKFFQVLSLDGTTSDKYVIEVDVVPRYSETQEKLFYTYLHIASEEKREECKTQCLFVREGPKSINVLACPNPRTLQEKMLNITEEVKAWASTRKSKEEERDYQNVNPNQEGLRLKQLITHGRDMLENSQQVIVVTNKCHPSQLEHLGFLKDMKLFAVLEFDPESDKNGTCNFYKKDRIANQHYPRMYSSQDNISNIIGKLNLFKQTSWVFCNGRANEESEEDKPFTTSDWLKKRAREISYMVSFLCNPEVLSKDRLLVIFILHSVVNDISSPILETFCAIFRTLGGEDNMLCICKDSSVFTQWRELIETRCKVDITSKCIYELNLNEIDCTIRKLKEPQTQSSRRYLPSTGSSSVLLTKRDEELMTVLDILSENECENTEIETNKSFEDFQTKTEEDFYRGGQVTWWNFYLSERPGCLPFIKREKFEDLYNLITPTECYTSPCVMINLFHHPGCGGTTMAMHVLWSLRRKFRCAVLKNNIAQNNEIADQVSHLLNCGKQEQSSYTPVLLLVDNWEDVEDLQRCILSAAREKKKNESLMVIILNCERAQFPVELSRNSRIDNVFITNKLSPREQSFFDVKLKDLEDHHEKPETFYAFMIMTNNFSEQYIENLVCNTLKDLDTSSKEGRLLSFLAMLNTYVNGSCMSLSLCEELVGIRNALWGRETLEDKMNPYSTLLIRFTVEEHGTYQAVRFLHQMIASNCLQVITGKHKLQLSEITTDLLHCDLLYKSCMGKDILVQNIQSMLITRQRKEFGNEKDTLFSPLIEDIQKDEGTTQIKQVLVRATERFDKNATVPQALARHFYLKEKDFPSALHWAQDAQKKKYNSYIADTLGQVHKSQMKYENELAEDLTPEGLDTCLKSASKAIQAFRDSQELAKKDEPMDSFEQRNRKRQRSFNTSGHVGEMDVTTMLFDVIKDIPFFNKCDALQKDRMLQFLKGHLAVSDFHETRTQINDQFIAILANHEKFLVSLRPRMKELFCFFEDYFTYLKPRSIVRETADDRNKRKISDHFKSYMQIFCQSGEEKASEKASKPHLSQRQEIEDQRRYLEEKRADSFAGLLQSLIEKNPPQMEFILRKWQFIIANSTRKSMSDQVNFILANIVLHCMKPSSTLVKRYEELVPLLNEALQEEGTRSNCTELYYLSMLLMWPTKDHVLENTTTFKNIGTYVTSTKKSFSRRFSHMLPARSAISHFFLGKFKGLKRIISKGRLDQALYRERPQTSQSFKDRTPNPHQLWQSGAIWKESQIQHLLLRVKGKTENGEIYVHYGSNLKILVRPVYLGGVRTGCSVEGVSFYLGFSMDGPVAYDLKYENDM